MLGLFILLNCLLLYWINFIFILILILVENVFSVILSLVICLI